MFLRGLGFRGLGFRDMQVGSLVHARILSKISRAVYRLWGGHIASCILLSQPARTSLQFLVDTMKP